MFKVIFRILAKILATLVVLLIVVPTTISILIRVDFIQNFTIKKLSEKASNFLGSEVSIGHVYIGGDMSLEASDIFVQDPINQDTLLHVKNLKTSRISFNFKDRRVEISGITLDTARLELETDKNNVINIKLIIDKIRGGRPKGNSNFKMLISNIIFKNFDFKYKKYGYKEVEDGINYEDLHLRDLSGMVNDLNIISDSIHMNINGMGFTEKSNVKGEDLSVNRFTITPELMLFEDGSFKIDSSYINFNKVKLTYKDWTMSDFINVVPMEVDITESMIHMATVAKFTKRFQKWDSKISFSGEMNGLIKEMDAELHHARVGKTYISNATINIKGLPDIENTIFDIEAPLIESSIEGVRYIVDEFSPSGMDTIDNTIRTGAKFQANASFKGKVKDFNATLNLLPLQDNRGVASVDVNVAITDKGIALKASTEITDLDLAYFLPNKYVSNLNSNIYLKGYINDDETNITAKGDVNSIKIKDYNYEDIDINMLYSDSLIKGDITIKDTSISAKLTGSMDRKQPIPQFNIKMRLDSLNLISLGLDRRNKVSMMKNARVSLDFTGATIDDINGGGVIDSISYVSNVDTVNLKKAIQISVRNIDLASRLNISSDIFDISYRGVRGYNDLYEYFMESISQYAPAIRERNAVSVFKNDDSISEKQKKENYYILSVDIKESSTLTNVFVPTLYVADSTKLSLIYNPYDELLSFSLNSKSIIYKNLIAEDLNVNGHNNSGALSFFAKLNSFETNNLYIPNLNLVGKVENNNIDMTVKFFNSLDNSEAMIRTKTLIGRDENGNTLDINIMPSLFRMQDRVWKTNNSNIYVDKKIVTFDNFSLFNEDQYLTLDGIISDKQEDKIVITSQKFNVETMNFIFSSFGYKMSGLVTGKATGYALKSQNQRKFNASIGLSSFNVNGITIPDAGFNSWWDDTDKKILFKLSSGNSNILDGYLKPSDDYYFAKVQLEGFNVSLISPFTKSIFNDVEGRASVDVTLSNPKGYFAIDGDVSIDEFKGRILFTNTTYTASGHAKIVDNQYSISDGLLTDEEGGKAPFTAFLTNEKYKKVHYGFDIRPEELLALNLSERDNSIFYGKAYASGKVIVDGNRNDVLLSIDATTAKSSTFFLPLSDKMTATEADFITFLKKEIKVDKPKRSLISSRRKKNELNTRFTMDIDLDIKPNLEAEIVVDQVTGSSIKVNGNGNLSLQIVPMDGIFTMNGDYIISKGTYRFILPNFNLIDKYFTIKEGGWIRWSGEPLGATMNVEAIYKVKASLAPLLSADSKDTKYNNRVNVECILSLRDNLINPAIKLGIDVPGADPESQSLINSMLSTEEDISTQLFFLLFSNSFYATASSSANNDAIGAATAAATGIEFFTNQIKSLLENDKFDFGINYRPKGDMTSNELELSVSAPILENRLYIDVEGSYNFLDNDASIASSNVNNFSGDFYLTWVVDNDGDIRVKGFSRTIDTFDENQGLQENGIGIYYKANFNNISDLKERYQKFWTSYSLRREERKKKKAINKQNRATKKAENIVNKQLDKEPKVSKKVK